MAARIETGEGRAINLRAVDVLIGSHWARPIIMESIGDGETSPSEIARANDLEVELVSYHVKRLADAAVLEKTRVVPMETKPPVNYYRVNPRFLAKVPDSMVLDQIATYLREHNGSAEMAKVRELVSSSGREAVAA